MKRKVIVAGNWKMNLTYNDAVKLTGALSKQISSSRLMEVVLVPPYPYLVPLIEQLRQDNCDISVGAQDCHTEKSGAYTGEVSADITASCGAKYVIVGHSERRAYFGEAGDELLQKVRAGLNAGLKVIFCVGEQLDDRKAGNQNDIVSAQLDEVINTLSDQDMISVVIAYEPVWAIGTGETATPEQAQEMHAHIRSYLKNKFDENRAEGTSILYGGSVKPTNAKELFSQQDVDGGLVGGASLDEHQFIAVVRSAQSIL